MFAKLIQLPVARGCDARKRRINKTIVIFPTMSSSINALSDRNRSKFLIFFVPLNGLMRMIDSSTRIKIQLVSSIYNIMSIKLFQYRSCWWNKIIKYYEIKLINCGRCFANFNYRKQITTLSKHCPQNSAKSITKQDGGRKRKILNHRYLTFLIVSRGYTQRKWLKFKWIISKKVFVFSLSCNHYKF